MIKFTDGPSNHQKKSHLLSKFYYSKFLKAPCNGTLEASNLSENWSKLISAYVNLADNSRDQYLSSLKRSKRILYVSECYAMTIFIYNTVYDLMICLFFKQTYLLYFVKLYQNINQNRMTELKSTFRKGY